MARFGPKPLEWTPLPEGATAPWACRACKRDDLKMSDYWPDKGCTYGKRKTCRECISAKMSDYRETDGYAKAERARKLRRNFNLTQEQYDAMFEAQGYACAICASESSGAREWHIDHDHNCCPEAGRSCGKCVRGILCHSCNLMLGHAKDDRVRLMVAAMYLEATSVTS